MQTRDKVIDGRQLMLNDDGRDEMLRDGCVNHVLLRDGLPFGLTLLEFSAVLDVIAPDAHVMPWSRVPDHPNFRYQQQRTGDSTV